jgi:hypothetical protein
MNAIRSLIKRYPQVTFWVIAISTFFLGAMLFGDMGLLAIYFVALGGLFVTAVADGRRGVKTYLSRIVRWRVGIQWYAVALFLPAVLYLVGAGLNMLTGAKLATNIQWPPLSEVAIGFLWPGLLGIALGEEPGFRGFALPRLLAGRRTAITAALILGVLHAVWHIPVIIQDGTIGIISTILIVISGSVINTWMFNHTNGSVFMAMLLHVGIDVASGDVGVLKHLFTGADLERQVIWQTVAFVAFAILLPILAGRELGRKPEAGMDMKTAEQPVLAR